MLLAGFADQLYTQGDYQMAALEYSRLLYQSGDTLGMPMEALRLARCRHLTGDYSGALELYGFLAGNLPDDDDRARALLGEGAVYAEMGFYGVSAGSYEEAASLAREEDLLFRSRLLSALAPAHEFRWEDSGRELEELAGSWQGDRGLLARELSATVYGGTDLPGRSPFWCGLASALVPGSGQMLCGHTLDGLTALGMTAATGALFYISLEEDNLSTSILLGWLSVSFYGANIYGGSRAAGYYNAARRRELLEEVYERLDSWEGN